MLLSSQCRDVLPLRSCVALRMLDLRGNPLSREAEYRVYSLFLLPSLKVLDGVDVQPGETEFLKETFSGRLTKELAEQILQKTLPVRDG